MVMAFVIWSAVCALFIGIGISCNKSSVAVGFFTFTESPEVKDINGYNKAVAKLWFVFGGIFEITGVPLLYLKQNSPLILLLMPVVIIWVISLIIAYLKIESKFRK